jgi:hypothetical protein
LLQLLVRIPTDAWCLSLVSVVWYKVEVSALGLSLVQRNPTECGVCECYREASIMRKAWPTGGSFAVRRDFWGGVIINKT